MKQSANLSQVASVAILAASMMGLAAAPAIAQEKASKSNPFFVHEGITKRLSEHVWEIPDESRPGVPNVAIVVGTRATLIVDTGMGQHGGTAVANEARKLSKNTEFYLATTDFRPEHITGGQALPANTKWVIPAAQKVDIETSTWKYINSFVSRSADLAEALKDIKLRDPDIVFDRNARIDLGGGVIVHLLWYGPARTAGDVAVFVEPDRLLHGGNFLGSNAYPSMPEDTPSVGNWLDVLDKLEALKPLIVLPNHGPVRDATLIASQRQVLRDLQRRAMQLKSEGKTPEQAGATLTAEFDVKYTDWKGLGNIPGIVRRYYELP